ncbi:PREDICTED: polygalacturonase non-catalytic subunit AroGP3-like isoform X2 [Ipomoea nil]|uniref:polygalacturonase non-catalytic subunit AroGP3-like isoform X1 n=1 Tax=Ipomoea nil TaxID=35883 RepID=UPI0009017B58|nr:PREDICTED: polygalacturonase non-catalytic subunit AroGP3-like isoform X1 [Ipomoea nil]XP_019184608.1 PREDICTED: polygalacturonase non-catalytic subunit AroGP3-like isoform X2 [Ipomoea nil]
MASLPFLLFTIFLSLVASNALSPSSVASQQSKFWSQNVDNNMPQSIRSKLSPLSELETKAFTPLVSKQYFTSNPKFCTSANLVCASAVKPIPCVFYHEVHFTDKVTVPIEEADPWSFFRLSILKNGNKVTLPELDSKFPNRAFLPSQIATSFRLRESELQRIFPIALSIPSTKASVDMSLHHCDAPTVKGERRSCLKTLEDMIEFSRDSLGRKHLVALASDNTKVLGNQVVMVKNVIKPYKTEKIVACHELFFPFATYYCHMLPLTEVYGVDVINKRGAINKLFAICHTDTSSWTPNHVAFKLLKTSPGKGEVCHWIGEMDLLWVGYD